MVETLSSSSELSVEALDAPGEKSGYASKWLTVTSSAMGCFQ